MIPVLPTVLISAEEIGRVLDDLSAYFFNTKSISRQESEHTSRTTYNFGYNYFKMQDGDYTFVEIPEFLIDLCKEIIKKFQQSLNITLPDYSLFKNVIVSIYQTGDQLEPHIDVDATKPETTKKPVDFFFGDDVLGVILESDINGHFYLQESSCDLKPLYDSKRAIHLKEEEGMAFLLNGIARREPYYHGVSPVQNKRISITYRTVVFL